MKSFVKLKIFLILFSVSLTANGFVDLTKSPAVTKDKLMNLPSNRAIGYFPFLILDKTTTIFDVCHEDGKFKTEDTTSNSEYRIVKSTFKSCTQHEFIAGSFDTKCKDGAIEEKQIPLKHKVPIIMYVGKRSYYGNNTQTGNRIMDDYDRWKFVQKIYRTYGGVPDFVNNFVSPTWSDNYLSLRKLNYIVPECF